VKISDSELLSKAREWLIDQVEEHEQEYCPCCGKLVKLYHRRIYDKQARGMIIAYNTLEQEQDWFHWYRTTRITGGDHAKLHHWGLMEASNRNRNPREPGVGNWRLTDKGVKFVRNTLAVPRCARVVGVKDQFVRWCDTLHPGEANIRTALGEEYDYDKMMGR